MSARLRFIAAEFARTFDLDAPPRLFGPWQQPLTSPLLPTPVGEPCYMCGVPIAEADTGEFLAMHNSLLVPFHVECLVLLYMGHRLGVCDCTAYAGNTNEDGSPNLREAAIVAGERLKAEFLAGAMRRAAGRADEEPS